MNIVELAKECEVYEYGPLTRNWSFELSQLERFAALVRAEREWVDLTDDEFQKIKNSLSRQHGWDGDGWDLALKEAVIAAFKEKNKC